jgi:cytochrome c peroxidase
LYNLDQVSRSRPDLQVLIGLVAAVVGACSASPPPAPHAPAWEVENPIRPPAPPPLGLEDYLADVKPPAPARARLGRWLFYDTRLSADHSISCASCHKPEYAFSEPTPVSTGIRGQKGARKAPSFINQAVTLSPAFFWDGRAASLEDQALGPIANPIEMGHTHAGMEKSLTAVAGYKPYFKEAFGTDQITKERVAQAIADYERTRVSGNSPYDRWRFKRDARAVSDAAKRGHDLFFDQAGCVQCHVGSNFTDGKFHNIGIGWDPRTKSFADEGRFAVTKAFPDHGAFKTPGLREVSKRAPYMHDGSIPTLRDVVKRYNDGGVKNPWLSVRIKPLHLSEQDVDALVAFLESLAGEGYQDTPPKSFPQ